MGRISIKTNAALILISVIGLIMTGSLTFRESTRLREELLLQRNETAEVTRKLMDLWLRDRFSAMTSMAKGIRQHGDFSPEEFSQQSRKNLDVLEGFQALNWIDPEWVIRRVEPLPTNPGAKDQDLHNHPEPSVIPAINKAVETGSLARTSVVTLLQGGEGVATYLPVFGTDGELMGFVNGVFLIRTLASETLDKTISSPRFRYRLLEGDGNLIRSSEGSDTAVEWPLSGKFPLPVADRPWTLVIAPTPAALRDADANSNWVLAAGSITSLIIVFLSANLLIRQRELVLSEGKFRAIAGDALDATRAGIMVLDRDRLVVWVNSGMTRYFGLDRSKMLGRDVLDLYKGRLGQAFVPGSSGVERIIESHRQGSHLRDLELLTAAREGADERWVEYRSQSIDRGLYAGGRIETFYGITARKFHEMADREDRDKLQAIYDRAADGILVADIEDLKFVECNESICRQLGYTREELLRLGVDDIHPPGELPRVKAAIERQVRGDLMTAGSLPVRRKDGTTFVADISASSVSFAGRPHLVGIFRDVTEKRRAEENFEAIFNGIGHPTVVLAPDNTIIQANSAMADKLGSSLEEIVGRKCWQVFHNPYADTTVEGCPFACASETGTTALAEMEVEMLGGFYLVSCTPLFDSAGQLSGVIHISTDITERKQLEDQLRQSQKMEAVGILSGGIAHDFNNLLQGITGYTGLALRNRGIPDETSVHLQKILSIAKQASVITSGLLAFSRKQVLDLHVIDLCNVVEGMAELLSHIIREAVVLCIECEDDPVTVLADSHQIQQVVMNLAVNARDAMPDGGELALTVYSTVIDEPRVRWPDVPPGRYAVLEVRDNGTGMDEDTLKHVFEPFFTTKASGRGTGLGLSTVFGIIKQHNGYIYCDSRPGEGATFSVLLHFRGGAVASAADDEAAVGEIWGGSETVLVAEDNEMVNEMVCGMLRSLGYSVYGALSPVEALNILDAHGQEVDILITDFIMPDMDGPSLHKEALKAHPALKVLYISGYSDLPQNKFHHLEGKLALLKKPFNINQLDQAVRKALDS